jgi:hypothetical protein
MKRIEQEYHVVVVGGGMAGVCAAIAAARNGCKTCLIHDRPVLGGNASSEIRVGIEGADYEFRHARETGILEEIRIEDRKRNYHRSTNGATNYVFDTILLEWVRKEGNLTLHLNTSVFEAITREGTIEAVRGLQSGSENIYTIHGDVFIDTSGDGVVAAAAGAEFRMGREGKEEFGESIAPDKPDSHTMGSSLLFHVVDRGRLVKFTPPEWAYKFPLDEHIWEHNYGWGLRGPYVWVEAGGDKLNTIHDNEQIMDELRKILYGAWDHVKNHGNHHAENMEMDWVGAIPGKRESRRIIGDHILTEGDIKSRTLFPDRVAYGGWLLDVHYIGGFWAPRDGNHGGIPLVSGVYSIPFRCLYSKNIDNLMMAGRNISASHVACGSSRIIATCAVAGQAVGTAAALCKIHGAKPREVGQNHVGQLQQTLLKDDCYLVRIANEDPNDLARKAKASASSTMRLALAEGAHGFPLDIERAQKIFVTESRLDRVGLMLDNKTDRRKTIALRIIRADFEDKIFGETCTEDLGGFVPLSREQGSFKYPDVLATAEARLPAGGSQWLEFPLDADLQPGPYWVILAPAEGVHWLATDEVIPALAAIYNVPGTGWSFLRQHLFLFELEPASYPFAPGNVNNGISRPEDWPNIWISNPNEELPQTLELDLGDEKCFDEVHLTFDTNLDKFLLTSGTYEECVSDYELFARREDRWTRLVKVQDNYMRKRVHRFAPTTADRLKLVVHRTNGVDTARVYEVRVYRHE